MNPKVWIVVIESTEVGHASVIDYVFGREDDAYSRKADLNGRYKDAGAALYAYVSERNVF